MPASSLGQDWDELAALDPLWAILSDKTKQFDRWKLDEFFETGSSEIAGVMRISAGIGYPRQRYRALDFGCGIGRLTRALQCYFISCTGVDISPTMIMRAHELNPCCEFERLDRHQLRIFPDQHFDMIYSNIVLQHQASVAAAKYYIAEFVRILKQGGLLVFQLPHYIPLRYRLQLRRRLYHALHATGIGSQLLYQRLHLNPIRMLAIEEKEVVRQLDTAGARTLLVVPDNNGGPHIDSRTYFATRSS